MSREKSSSQSRKGQKVSDDKMIWSQALKSKEFSFLLPNFASVMFGKTMSNKADTSKRISRDQMSHRFICL